jgi:hypothetical protein
MKRKDLVSALKQVMPGIEMGTPLLEGSDTFLFTGHEIKSNNGRLTVSYPMETGIVGSVKAVEFLKILERMTSDDIDITTDKDVLIVKTDKTELRMNLMDLPAMPEISQLEFKDLPEDFIQGLNLCSISLVNNPIIGNLSGICVSDTDILSSDNQRASWFTMSQKVDFFVIPTESVQYLLKFKEPPTQYAIEESQVYFSNKEGLIFACNRLADNYPVDKCKGLFDHEDNLGEFKLPKGLLEAIDRVKVLSFSQDFNNFISLKKNKDNVIVTGEKEFGKIKDKVKIAEGESFPDEVTVNIVPEFLETVLKVSYKCQATEDQLIFEMKNFKHLIVLV